MVEIASGEITTFDIQCFLEWAGARLIALSVGRVRPADPKVIWPEYSQEKFEVLDFRGRVPLRMSAPSSIEIPIMDEILTLPNICSEVRVRRVLHYRALVHPLNGRYLNRWTDIAIKLKSNRRDVKRWFVSGLEEVLEKTPKDKVCRIASFLHGALGIATAPIDKQP